MHYTAVKLIVTGIGLASLSGCGETDEPDGGQSTSRTTTRNTESTLTTTTMTTTTTTKCDPGPEPERPNSPFELNGKAWPKMCKTDKNEAHFFGIGDWGGDQRGGKTWPNPGKGHSSLDEFMQRNVANRMNAHAENLDPDFVLNAGDNFYPGGIIQECPVSPNETDPTEQFAGSWNSLYNGPGLDGKPWFGVFGNHDWGGISWHMGTDVQIFHTWDSDYTWRIPALYWSQLVQYENFSIEIWMLETNLLDAHANPGEDPKHNICQRDGDCYGMNLGNCYQHFQQWWEGSFKMLEEGLKKSEATWKIVVTHYQAYQYLISHELDEMSKRGVVMPDLIFGGHKHMQESGTTDAGIPFIVSGGGGGVTADAPRQPSGYDDAYGFVHFTANETHLRFDMHSWGGLDNQEIIRSSTTLTQQTKPAAQPLV